MNKKTCTYCALIAIVLLSSFSIFAQSKDSSYLLKTVEIKSLKPDFTKNNYLNEIYTAQSLQNQWSDLYIKNYGIGQLSTFSVRGLGAENVALLWSGIPINSPMNGLLDLNQIPNSLLQNIHFSNESRLNSGGELSISNTDFQQNQIALSSTAYLSNLFSYKVDGQFQFQRSKFSFINQLTHGENDYEFIHSDLTKKRIHHNAVQQINTQLFYNYALDRWDIQAGFWYQNQDRDIPASEFYPVETQSLIDRNWRGFLGLKNKNLDVKLAYMNESQQYNDQNISFPMESRHKVATWKGTFSYFNPLNNKLKLSYQLYPAHYNVSSTSLADSSIDIIEAIQILQMGYQINEKLKLDAGLKSQINSNFNNLLLPFTSIEYKMNQRWTTSLTADINERNPTMNDLYFQFYGNINLRPETNYQIKNSWRFLHLMSMDKIQFSFEPYYIHSVDKINYVPDSAFRVFNIDRATSMGFHSQLEWVRKMNSLLSLRTILGVNYIDAKNQNDQDLAYVPKFKTVLSLNLIHRNYEISMLNQYTASRYTDAANSGSLPAYFITNLKATYKHSFHASNRYLFSIGIDNLWNENYKEIQGSYMPLRNYYLNLTAILR